ncbi:MAG: ABC transporter ATP-binding protein, partial [Planctomycetaceae bacterium]
MTNAVELSGVTKKFRDHTAVDGLDLAVPKGSIYGFIGPNGSGKTTTIRMILRIFQPDAGTVSVLGQTAGTAADSRLGYLPEERGLYKRMKVKDVCAYYAKLKGHYDCKSDIDDWLQRLGATEWANKRVDALSKGMAQKVQFITSVVARPELLILDEPFSGLDPVNLEVLRDAVLEMRNRGTTVIFSTHDMDVAEKLCDTIFMIFKGQKVLDGSVDSIQQQYARNQVTLRLANGDPPPDLQGVTSSQADG